MNELLVSRLRSARTNKNMKQQDVADILGIKPNTLSNWEKGRTEPDIDTFVRLCDIYGIDCASLLEDVYAFKRIKSEISLSEYELIKKYRALDAHGKKMVDFTLENEWERSTKSIMEGQVSFLTEEGDACCRVWRNGKFEEHDDGNLPQTSVQLNAAHARTDQEATDSDLKHDNDIMDDDNF